MIDKISGMLRAFTASAKKEETGNISPEKSIEETIPETKHIYRGDYPPTRRLFLWGRDKENNPGFLVLYGEHKFKHESYGNNELEECVTYTDGAVFRGAKGHFPSFAAVEIYNSYNYKNRQYQKKMYYKKDLRIYGSWTCAQEKKELNTFFSLKEPILIPYFKPLSHEDYVRILVQNHLSFPDFHLAKNQGEVLALKEELAALSEPIYTLFSHPNLYMRKKYLSQILASNPDKGFYDLVLTAGSEELIAGLFLELAKKNDDILISEARAVIEANGSWWQQDYAKGIKRCAALYINLFDEEWKNKQIGFIREHLAEMDLKLLYINEKKLPEDKKLTGADYRKYSLYGQFSEYTGHYSYEERKIIRYRRTQLFAKNYYSDGVILDIVKFKNTIQEAEILGLADAIGRIAYYCDAPRLVYYFKGNNLGRSLKYFRRYLRRIIDGYAKNDEMKFIAAMKSLFISYEDTDYLNKFPGNFQESYFIRHYLYHDFQEKKPEGWYEGFEWIKEDQLKKLTGRYELHKDIWDRHLDAVLAILCNGKIEVVLKAFYYIFAESEDKETFLQGASYEQLVRLAEASYQPAADLAVTAITNRLAGETEFHGEIMIGLVNCSNKQVCQIAMAYFSRTNGRFAAAGLVELLAIKNREEWTDLFAQGIERLDEDEYITFIKLLVSQPEQQSDYPEALNDVLEQSLDKLAGMTIEQRAALITGMIAALCTGKHYVPFIETVLFSMSLLQLEAGLGALPIQYPERLPARSRSTLAFLTGIQKQQLLSDSQIIDILENATAKMVRMLIAVLSNQEEQLKTRFSTILILFEADVEALNEQARRIFRALPEAGQKQLHSVLLDSPDKKVYSFALEQLYQIYEQPGAMIPEDLVLQMFEHPAAEVKAYISGKLLEIISSLGNGNKELFLYYAKTLLLLPNKVSAGKKNIYEMLPLFVKEYPDKQADVEAMLLEIGGSNIILDSERALVALAQIRKGAI